MTASDAVSECLCGSRCLLVADGFGQRRKRRGSVKGLIGRFLSGGQVRHEPEMQVPATSTVGGGMSTNLDRGAPEASLSRSEALVSPARTAPICQLGNSVRLLACAVVTTVT